MKDTVRFGEYTISGGVFWLLFGSLFTLGALLTQGMNLTPNNAIELWEKLASPLAPLGELSKNSSFSALLTAIAVILLFITGLFLDLVSQFYFAIPEAIFFRREINKHHRGWLDSVMAKHPDFILENYQQFLETPVLSLSAYTQRQQCQRYSKLHSFMLSNILFNADGASSNELLKHLGLWSAVRSITISILLFCSLLISIVQLGTDNEVWLIVTTSFIAVTTLLSILISLLIGMFSRVSFRLFTLMYAIEKQS